MISSQQIVSSLSNYCGYTGQSSNNHSNNTNRIPCFMFIVTVSLLVLSDFQIVSSNPVPSTKGGAGVPISVETLRHECYPGSDLRDLCEMCAKVTRNVNTFPWCCTHKFNVTLWCEEYLTYTIGPAK